MQIAIPAKLTEEGVRGVLTQLESNAAREAKAIVLEGSAEAFCVGLDLTAPDVTRTRLGMFTQLLHALLRAPRPTIAIVDGQALGGGLGIVSACDYVIASDRARFGLPERCSASRPPSSARRSSRA